MRYRLILIRALAVFCCFPLLVKIALAEVEQQNLVIVDNDFNGPPNTLSNLRSALMFLENPKAKVLGFTVVTGDGWRDEEVCHLLKLLEIARRTDIPVVPGAVYPLVNSQMATEVWEKEFGAIGYKGAWDPASGRRRPDEIPPLREGMPAPNLKPTSCLAPVFMIDQVRAHPHEVSIFAGGPLTDLALAVRLDPDFPRLVKELVFMGAFQHLPHADFNMRFDPEAAHIVMTAPWPSIISVGDVTSESTFSSDSIFSKENIEKIRAANTAIGKYVVEYSQIDIENNWSVWDELAAAVLIDPSIVMESEDIYLDIDIDHGGNYGRVKFWDPSGDVRKIRVVNKIDPIRFEQMFIKTMSAAPGASP